MSLGDAAFVAGSLAGFFILRWIVWHLLRSGHRLTRAGWRRLAGSSAVQQARPLPVWLQARMPAGYRIVAARVRLDRFDGLPLTLIVVGSAYIAFLFTGLIEEVREAEELQAFDEAVAAALEPVRSAVLVVIFAWITRLADMTTLVAVATVSTAFLLIHGPGRYVLPLWISVLGSQATTWATKLAIARERPEFLFDVTAVSPSFPSGHATGAMAVYGVIAYLLARDLPRQRQRFELVYWTAVLIGLIAFSRVYVSVHFTSDVIAGLMVGGFWLLIGIAVAELRQERRAPRDGTGCDSKSER